MKRLLLLIFFSGISIGFSQEKKDLLKNFDKSGMETSILYLKSPFMIIDSVQYLKNNMHHFYAVYKAISQSDLQNRFVPLKSLKEKATTLYATQVIPITILHSEFETISDDAFKDGRLIQDAKGFVKRATKSAHIFEKHEVTIISALKNRTKGLETRFKISSENIFNTTTDKIRAINIDFMDEKGFREVIIDEEIKVYYAIAGKKEINVQLLFSDGKIKKRTFILDVRYSLKDIKNVFNRTASSFTASITPDLSVYGESVSHPGEGEYELFLSTEPDAVLDKPIIIIDGFDPTDSRPIAGYTDELTGEFINGIYELLNFNDNGNLSNLADLVRAEGFDVVILNFPEYTRAADGIIIDGGTDFIERNAMLLVDLINTINSQKVGTNKNVVIGPSMGGLISRYALSYMESQSLNHDTRLWVSFDSPHNGANVPIGFQHLFNYLAYGMELGGFAGNANIVELQPIVDDLLKSAAARQMLTDHFEAHLANGSDVEFNTSLKLPISHPYKSIFYNRLNSLTVSGFPENLRKISIINGSGDGNLYQNIYGNDILPGTEVVNTIIEGVSIGTDVTLKVRFTPEINMQNQISYIFLDAPWICFCDLTASANSQAFSYSNGIDAAMGGLFNLGALTEDFGTGGTTGAFLAALQTDYFNFIPTVSAMALEVPNNHFNWFQIPDSYVSAKATSTVTPFDAWYTPEFNEPHVTLTQANVEFAWNEIVTAVLAVDEVDINNDIVIGKNPIKNTLTLINNNVNNISSISIEIFDVLGKKILQRIKNNPDTRIEIPVNLNSGMYYTIIKYNEFVMNKKLIVE
jgi:hypothetical protein